MQTTKVEKAAIRSYAESADYLKRQYLDLFAGAYTQGARAMMEAAEKWIKKNVLEFSQQTFTHEFDECVKDFHDAMIQEFLD